jgi:thymidylate kinase
MSLVAVEGPCCAGKTTLSSALVVAFPRSMHVRCYADWVGGGRHLPNPVPRSASQDVDALDRLLAVERDRLAEARRHPSQMAVADRSAHTLLAHRAGVERVTGLDLLSAARATLASAQGVGWPDLVLYLDTPLEVIHARNNGKFPPDSVFTDAEFNASFRDFFAALAADRPGLCVWLDATESRYQLRETAAGAISALRPAEWPG